MTTRAIRSQGGREIEKARSAIKAASELSKLVLVDKRAYDQTTAMLARIGMYAGNPQAVLKRLGEISDKAKDMINEWQANRRKGNRRVEGNDAGGEAVGAGERHQDSPA